MPLKLVTLTGADDSTDPRKLSTIAKRFPFVEFAILWSPTRAGSGRYPSRQWISEFCVEADRSNINCALHLCGGSVPSLLEFDPGLVALTHPFSRLQLNWAQTRNPLDLDQLSRFIHKCGRSIITQHNHANHSVTQAIDAKCHEVLFDASGGAGREADMYPSPIPGKRFCGYAGGLGPDNIERLLLKIDGASAGKPYWIDMETRLRSAGDKFDLRACVEVLVQAERFRINASRPMDVASNAA